MTQQDPIPPIPLDYYTPPFPLTKTPNPIATLSGCLGVGLLTAPFLLITTAIVLERCGMPVPEFLRLLVLWFITFTSPIALATGFIGMRRADRGARGSKDARIGFYTGLIFSLIVAFGLYMYFSGLGQHLH